MQIFVSNGAEFADGQTARREEHSSMHHAECVFAGCSIGAVITFGEEALCLKHFCSRCYEFLNRADRRGGTNGSKLPASLEIVRRADECARKTLDVCLNTKLLSNLERGRLLDILLWCGDIANALSPMKSRQKDSNRIPKSTAVFRNVSSEVSTDSIKRAN